MRDTRSNGKITNSGPEDLDLNLASLMAKMIKHLPTMQETQVRSMGWKDPLEKEMANHSSILAWKSSWTEELGKLQSMGSQRAGHAERLTLSLSFTPG